MQEAVKILHDDRGFLGRGFVFDGKSHNSYRVEYAIKPDCRWHEPTGPVREVSTASADTTLSQIVAMGSEELGGCDGLDFAHELVLARECSSCGARDDLMKATPNAGPEDLVCPHCGEECRLDFAHGLAVDSPYLKHTAQDLGLPAWDII